jgi:DNA invertase Pin-like site-specific DNA recombinase
MNMSKSVWIEMQELIAKVINDNVVLDQVLVDDVADEIARNMCKLLDMPDEVQDANYGTWMEARQALNDFMDKKEKVEGLKQECKELDNERSKLIVQLENAVGYENIKPIVDSLHDNRKLVTENLEAIKDAEAG